MNAKDITIVAAVATALGLVALGAYAKGGGETKGRSSKTAETSVATNENGSVCRMFTESTVTTNGNMVTEHRRETRTNTDRDGNILETSTSEYAQSYPIGDNGMLRSLSTASRDGDDDAPVTNTDSFLGLRFGETYAATNFVTDAHDPDFLRATFRPERPLDGFDDYYVYVTPKTHKVVKVYACAKDAIEPSTRWHRHYLLEALEKRYQTWARLCSWRLPCYAFDIGGGRHITACLDGATRDYSTVIYAWDDDLTCLAAEECEQIREEARKTAAEKRNRRVSAAAEAF